MISTAGRLVSRLKPSRSLRAFPLAGIQVGPGKTLAQPIVIRRQPPRILGRMGPLEVRLARSRGDVRRAQRLRYRIFYEEMSAIPSALALMSRRDEDPYDGVCDHLLVVDHAALPAARRWTKRPEVVGTYRMLRQDAAELSEGFYTQGEYDVQPLVEARADLRFLELGRSCVMKSHRNRRTLELLWHGIWSYVREHGCDVMIGCASFEGTDPSRHAEALSYLHHTALAPEAWRVRAHDHRRVGMNMLPLERIDQKAAIKALPPLIKGYLRVGAFVGDGAVVDHQFGTTDVFVIMPVREIRQRYFAHFGAPNEIGSRIGHSYAPLN